MGAISCRPVSQPGAPRSSGSRCTVLPSNERLSINSKRMAECLGWLTPAEFAQTMNSRRDVVPRSRNGSASQHAATAQDTKTQNRWGKLKTG